MRYSLYRYISIFVLFAVFGYSENSSAKAVADWPEETETESPDEEEEQEVIQIYPGSEDIIYLRLFANGSGADRSYRTINVSNKVTLKLECQVFEHHITMPYEEPLNIEDIRVEIEQVYSQFCERVGSYLFKAIRDDMAPEEGSEEEEEDVELLGGESGEIAFQSGSGGEYVIDKTYSSYFVTLYPGTYRISYAMYNSNYSEDEGLDGNDGDDSTNELSQENGPKRVSEMLSTCKTITLRLNGIYCGDEETEERVIPDPDGVDYGLTLGAISGNSGVSQAGGATYDILIEVPKYFFTPKVSISYDSQMLDYGLAGYGVNISGFSSIKRGGKNLFYDGVTQGIKYTDDDVFLLDGKRLMPTGTKDIFTVEGNPYSNVEMHHDGGDIWFSFADKGVVYEYGKSTGSRNTYTNKAGDRHTTEWFVNRATDSNGNYMTYSYSQVNMAVYPTEILYGMNESNPGARGGCIEFNYDRMNTNGSQFVIEDQRGRINQCVKSIVTKTGSSVFREYTFNYDESWGAGNIKYTRLKNIEVSKCGGMKLPSLNFNWNYLT